MQHLFCFFCWVLATLYTTRLWWLSFTHVSAMRGRRRPRIYAGHSTTRCRPMQEKRAHTKSSLGRAPHAPSRQKMVMAVPGFEPGSSGSQPLMLTTTLYHHGWDTSGIVEIRASLGGAQVQMTLFLDEGPPRSAMQLL
jgi:hypothetical protein